MSKTEILMRLIEATLTTDDICWLDLDGKFIDHLGDIADLIKTEGES